MTAAEHLSAAVRWLSRRVAWIKMAIWVFLCLLGLLMIAHAT